jgi:hypothetical protein
MAIGRPIVRSGRRSLALVSLVALAACASPTNTVSNNSSGAASVASADSSHTIEKVSDALGQRLDSMLSSQHTGTLSR